MLVIRHDIRMIIVEPRRKALVEFISSKKNDIIADQFCYLLTNIFLDPFDDPERALTSTKQSHDQLARRELFLRIVLEEYPASVVAGSMLLVRRSEDNLATVNLDERRVDCQDEYMRMRLYGLIDQYIGGIEDP